MNSDATRKLKQVISNIDYIISYIDSFEKNCLSGLLINGNTAYKNSVTNIENSINSQKTKIRNEILVELEKNEGIGWFNV